MSDAETSGPTPPRWEVDPDPVRLEMREEIMRLTAEVAALEARLAEVAPVVAAAERQADMRPGDGPALTAEQRGHYDPEHLAMLAAKYPWLRATVDVENAVRALRAARARREASGA